ncbi:proteasome activator complex subunit 4-like [Cydia pomonella]|uniref:proteasome activator complex subunit 4-like n=1 Tax=Cydia pomonella TaxID=82600 RepID=UPI002ADD75C2|nr:proteasome activator complex subunit 4-like [Cydia pomonella]
MSAVAAVARPMLQGAHGDYPEGPTHVVPLLLAVLPGLDPNDIKKTLVTLHFILIFSWMVPYIDCSSAHEHWPDLTEEELLTCESTAQFEDFVLVFLDRLFTIIESSVMEHVRLDTKESDCVRSKTDAVMETAISSAATSVLMQCSPKIFKEALKKFKAFANESTYETNVSGSMIGVLLKVFARIDSESTLAAFVPDLCEELNELLSTEEAIRDENPQRDLSYSLVLLMNVVECDGVVLLKYIPQIIPVLDKALKLHAKYSLIRACEILSHMFTSLCFVDLKEWRSSPKDYGSAPQTWLPIREWGRGCLLKEADFKWHVPCEEEAACAQMLVDRYAKDINWSKQLTGELGLIKVLISMSQKVHSVLCPVVFFDDLPDGMYGMWGGTQAVLIVKEKTLEWEEQKNEMKEQMHSVSKKVEKLEEEKSMLVKEIEVIKEIQTGEAKVLEEKIIIMEKQKIEMDNKIQVNIVEVKKLEDEKIFLLNEVDALKAALMEETKNHEENTIMWEKQKIELDEQVQAYIIKTEKVEDEKTKLTNEIEKLKEIQGGEAERHEERTFMWETLKIELEEQVQAKVLIVEKLEGEKSKLLAVNEKLKETHMEN